MFQLTKLEARVRAIGVLQGWVFFKPLGWPPREVEAGPARRDWVSWAYSILVSKLMIELKDVLTCRIAMSFCSWPMWLREREDTRSSTEKDMGDV